MQNRKREKNRIRQIVMNRRFRFGVTALTALVVFAVVYMLILPAITLEKGAAQDTPGLVFDTGAEMSSEGGDSNSFTGESRAGGAQNDASGAKAVSESTGDQGTEETSTGIDSGDDSGRKDSVNDSIRDSNDSSHEGHTSEQDQDPASDESRPDQGQSDIENDSETGTEVNYLDEQQEAEGEDYSVSVDLTENAQIPSDAYLYAEKLTEQEAKAYKKYARKELGIINFDHVQFFDIGFRLADQEEVEPAAPVKVTIRIDDYVQPEIVHFTKKKACYMKTDKVTHGRSRSGAKKKAAPRKKGKKSGINQDSYGTSVSFTADSFSVYAIVDAPSAYLNLEDPSGFYLSYNINSPMYCSSTLNKNDCFVEKTNIAEAAVWHFEAVSGAQGQYYIYTEINGERLYMKQKSENKMELSDQGSAFTIGEGAYSDTIQIKLASENRWLQHSKGGNGIRLYTDAKDDTNCSFMLTSAGTGQPVIGPDDYYQLDGKTYGIAYNNDSSAAAALMGKARDNSHLSAEDMLIKPDVLNNSGILLVAKNSDITEWTFHSQGKDKYTISAETENGTLYLCLNQNKKLSLVEESQASVIRLSAGSGENKGKYLFSVGSNKIAIDLNGQNTGKGFWSTASGSWLNLVEKSSLTDDDFVEYSARKISVSDESLSREEKPGIVIYTRVWNEAAKKYEFYAVDHDGSLLRVYDSGDLINWVGSQVNSALWEFTEYTNADGTPNYFYELQNIAFANTYLVPQSGGIIAEQATGVNLEGRRNGFDYTTILSWDDAAYGYSGLKVETDDQGKKRVVTCHKDEADDFYFAVLTPPVHEADPLTTVKTVDNSKHGISIKMVDFNNNIINNRDVVQDAFFGGHPYVQDSQDSGLLSTNLEANGYPTTTEHTGSAGRSLSELFNGMTAANHLFIESVYNESGYFEYDSTQNFAHLNGDGNFTVYNQLGAIGTTTSDTRTHGQFMPYNDISQEVGYAHDAQGDLITNKTDVLRNELPDSDPRKGEPLYSIPQKNADYYFGMELSASFTQTPDGVDNWGHDIIFEFTGDDDFWFYVDNELVLDLGGIHSAMAGTVNFRTGEVVNNGTQTTLYDIFKANYAARGLDPAAVDNLFEEKQVNGNTVHVFKDYTNHTMKMFYMERGAGASNLKMRFNLASVKPGTVELSKKLTGTQSPSNKLMQYPYQIWYATANYKKNEDGSYVLDGNGERVVEGHNAAQMMEQALSPNDPTRVVYKGTNTLVPFKESLTIDGIEYRNVFLLKPGETAVIMFPEDTYQYKTIECGVDTKVYEKVFVNGYEITNQGKSYNNTDGESPAGEGSSGQAGSSGETPAGRKDFGINYEDAVKRPKVEYNNQVAQGVMRTLSIKKAVYGTTGQLLSDEEAANVDATFNFRLYLGNEFADAGDLPLANMYTYYVRDPQGYYGKWDAENQTFTRLEGVRTFDDFMALDEKVRRSATYTTSMYGAISKIRAGYTVEVRDLIVGTKYKVEERDSEIPKGYTRRSSDGYVRTDLENEDDEYVYYTVDGSYGKHKLTNDSTITAEPISDTIASNTDSPDIQIRNQEGWGLTAKKLWTDKDFIIHDPIYLAVYLRTGSEPHYTYTLLPDMVRQMTNSDKEAYFFFQDLKVGGETYSFDQFVVREVELIPEEGHTLAVDSAGKVTVDDHVTVTPIDNGDSITVGGTPVGGSHRDEVYTVSYQTGTSTGHNHNIRDDTVTNSRPGIQIFKTDWEGHNFLSGASFTLKDENGYNVAAASYTSDNSGLVTTAYLSPGTYKLAEIKTPSGYVVMDGEITITVSKDINNKDTFTVEGDDDYFTFTEATETAMARITVKNRTVQELKIVKEGVDGNNRTPLSGVQFALYEQVTDNEGNQRPAYSPKQGYDNLVTKENGVIEEINKGLEPGTYYLREKAAPSGYKKLANDLCFTLGQDGTVTIHNEVYANWLTKDTSVSGTVSYQISVENTPLGITIRKTDDTDKGNLLLGSQFVLSRKNNSNVFTPVSNYGLGEDGLIDMTAIAEKTFSGMANGIYKLTEKQAPEGYIITTSDIYFSVSDGTVKLTDENGNETAYSNIYLSDENTTIVVKNTPGAALPYTGGPGTRSFVMVGIILLLLAGAGLMIRRRVS